MDSTAPRLPGPDETSRGEAVAALRWIRRPQGTDADPVTGGGVLNLCYNAIDRHLVAGRSDDTALRVGSGTRAGSWSYARLLEETAAFAGALRMLGAGHGASVPMLLPDGRDAAVAMLACWRIGAVPHRLPLDLEEAPLARLIERLAPPLLLTSTASSWARALDGSAHQVASVVVRQPADGDPVPLSEPRDLAWDVVARAGRDDPAACARVAAEEPAFVEHAADGPEAPVASGSLAVAAMRGAAAAGTTGAVAPTAGSGPALAVLGPLLAGAVLEVAPA